MGHGCDELLFCSLSAWLLPACDVRDSRTRSPLARAHSIAGRQVAPPVRAFCREDRSR
ncbi:conserved hypothetical protein [Xanthomonas citri pv. fuscans]|nr:conserved hypothetical protein [Xanthomonas citri pv. fuscans]SOO04045.1 conserved hypothetical protein [Xanthomonas citri pv. fuscans]SOO06027.1 conserved hypothetical protein [Xanthomonas citri pv. fuscans]SOO10706.1 conserved hypothetical protein [Xanthomonas citri pv. fuscans]SOO16578.1 conserved hypothetical protein [Xanthomonas citri pv. fuscans]